MKNFGLKFLQRLAALFMIVFWMGVLFRIGTYPENHIGVNYLWINVGFVLAAITSVICIVIYKNKESFLIFLFSIGSILLGLALFHYNILLPYETWINKGMPDRPF